MSPSIYLAAAAWLGQMPPTTDTSTTEVILVEGARLTDRVRETRQAGALDIVDLKTEAILAVDMGSVLRRTRGIVVRQSGGLGAATTLSLNGLSGQQIPVFLDGLPLAVSGFPLNLAAVPVGLLEKVEVHKGVVPVELGTDALGGALDLRSSQSMGARAFASYELASFGTHRLLGSVQVPLGDHLYFQAQTFYDYSDNDFDITVDAIDPDTLQVIPYGLTTPKGNAEFESFGTTLEVGWRNLSWADRISVSAFYGDGRRGLPHDPRQLVAYGEVETGRRAIGGRALYERTDLLPSLDASLGFGAVVQEDRLTDLAETGFGFDGQPTAERPVPRRGERFTNGVDQDLSTITLLSRLLLTYNFGSTQQLMLSVAPSYEERNGTQNIPSDPPIRLDIPTSSRFALVGGLSYRWQGFALPIENDLFIKGYLLDAQGELVRQGFETGPISVTATDFGVGDAMVYKATDVLTFRFSGEWARRLPSFLEVFGDLVQVNANPDLVPERSINLNASSSLSSLDIGFGTVDATLWGFARIVDDLIITEAGTDALQARNVDSSIIYGVEVDLGWTSPEDVLMLSGALTYEEARNTSLEGELARFRDDRLPNRPFLYGSAQANLGLAHLFWGRHRGGLTANMRWVEAFFLFWPSSGTQSSKAEVPAQLSLDVGLYYRLPMSSRSEGAALNLSLESHNVLDELLFDQFGVQRPGRSFHAKLSASFDPS